MTTIDRSPLGGSVWPWLIVIVFIAVGAWPTRAPPAQVDAPPDEFSADRAREHVAIIAGKPHPMGSPEIVVVRDYIVAQLRGLGVEPDLQSATAPDYFGPLNSIEIVNIVARLPGATGDNTIAFVGHYDTMPETPGANDNTAAVAVMLETARALLAGSQLENDILLVFTDAEEPSPRHGSTAFVSNHPAADEIDLVVNLEANGSSGASLLVETSGPEAWLIEQYSHASAHPAAFSFLTETSRMIGEIGTDFDVFQDAGIPGLHFAYLRGSSIYHTERDNLDSIGLDSMQHHGEHTLGIARHFGNIDLTAMPDDGTAVFMVAGPAFISYSARWVPLVALIVSGAVVAAAWRSNATLGTPRLSVAFGLLAIVVAATLAWMLLARIRGSMSAIEGYIYFGLIGAATVAGAARLRRRLEGATSPGYRALLPWLILTVVTALIARGFSYLFAWPVLAAAFAIWWNPDVTWQRAVRFGLVAAVTLTLLIPAIDVFVLFASPRPGNPDSNLPYVIALPLALTLMTFSLLKAFWPTRE